MFVLSFVSSSNIDVKIAEQFIVLHKRYVCDFSGLTNFSQKLCKLEEIRYIVLYFLCVAGFLAFNHNEFFDAFH